MLQRPSSQWCDRDGPCPSAYRLGPHSVLRQCMCATKRSMHVTRQLLCSVASRMVWVDTAPSAVDDRHVAKADPDSAPSSHSHVRGLSPRRACRRHTYLTGALRAQADAAAGCTSPYCAGASCWGGQVPSANGAIFDLPLPRNRPRLPFTLTTSCIAIGCARHHGFTYHAPPSQYVGLYMRCADCRASRAQ